MTDYRPSRVGGVLTHRAEIQTVVTILDNMNSGMNSSNTLVMDGILQLQKSMESMKCLMGTLMNGQTGVAPPNRPEKFPPNPPCLSEQTIKGVLHHELSALKEGLESSLRVTIEEAMVESRATLQDTFSRTLDNHGIPKLVAQLEEGKDRIPQLQESMESMRRQMDTLMNAQTGAAPPIRPEEFPPNPPCLSEQTLSEQTIKGVLHHELSVLKEGLERSLGVTIEMAMLHSTATLQETFSRTLDNHGIPKLDAQLEEGGKHPFTVILGMENHLTSLDRNLASIDEALSRTLDRHGVPKLDIELEEGISHPFKVMQHNLSNAVAGVNRLNTTLGTSLKTALREFMFDNFKGDLQAMITAEFAARFQEQKRALGEWRIAQEGALDDFKAELRRLNAAELAVGLQAHTRGLVEFKAALHETLSTGISTLSVQITDRFNSHPMTAMQDDLSKAATGIARLNSNFGEGRLANLKEELRGLITSEFQQLGLSEMLKGDLHRLLTSSLNNFKATLQDTFRHTLDGLGVSKFDDKLEAAVDAALRDHPVMAMHDDLSKAMAEMTTASRALAALDSRFCSFRGELGNLIADACQQSILAELPVLLARSVEDAFRNPGLNDLKRVVQETSSWVLKVNHAVTALDAQLENKFIAAVRSLAFTEMQSDMSKTVACLEKLNNGLVSVKEDMLDMKNSLPGRIKTAFNGPPFTAMQGELSKALQILTNLEDLKSLPDSLASKMEAFLQQHCLLDDAARDTWLSAIQDHSMSTLRPALQDATKVAFLDLRGELREMVHGAIADKGLSLWMNLKPTIVDAVAKAMREAKEVHPNELKVVLKATVEDAFKNQGISNISHTVQEIFESVLKQFNLDELSKQQWQFKKESQIDIQQITREMRDEVASWLRTDSSQVWLNPEVALSPFRLASPSPRPHRHQPPSPSPPGFSPCLSDVGQEELLRGVSAEKTLQRGLHAEPSVAFAENVEIKREASDGKDNNYQGVSKQKSEKVQRSKTKSFSTGLTIDESRLEDAVDFFLGWLRTLAIKARWAYRWNYWGFMLLQICQLMLNVMVATAESMKAAKWYGEGTVGVITTLCGGIGAVCLAVSNLAKLQDKAASYGQTMRKLQSQQAVDAQTAVLLDLDEVNSYTEINKWLEERHQLIQQMLKECEYPIHSDITFEDNTWHRHRKKQNSRAFTDVAPSAHEPNSPSRWTCFRRLC